jgi:DNA primase
MKGVGKRVDFNHIVEKVNRDLEISDEGKISRAVENLLKEGSLEKVGKLYGITKSGSKKFAVKFKKLEKEIEKINKPWLIVYKAKQYYPKVAKTVLEFCRDRYVGFYCLFTDKRFFRRDFKGRKIVLRNEKDLKFFVGMHCIDIIPCVHRINSNRPDWLVIDIDAGPLVSFEQTKEVTEIVFKTFEKFKLNPCLKFSGSRGFQIWSLIENFEIPKEYEPLKLKGETKREKNYFTLFSDFVRVIQQEVDKEIPNLTTSDVSRRELRKDKVLLDPSCMKPMGLVRVPYGVHSKTGLVSNPLTLKELKKFEPSLAEPEVIVKRYERRGNEFSLKSSNPKKLLEILLKK